MIPFKSLISQESYGGDRWDPSGVEDYENGARRQMETREFKRFSSRWWDRGKRKLQVVEEGEETEGRGFWSCSRFRSNVKSHGGVLQECNGALGDLGTFLPAVLATALMNGLDLGTTLVFTGIYNVATGVLFGVPMPVQPMSAIIRVAIAVEDPLTASQIMAAGLSTGITVGILGLSGMMSLLYRILPTPVVRGIMLSEGLTSGFTAVKYILEKQDLTTLQSVGSRNWGGIDGIVLPLSAIILVFLISGTGKAKSKETTGKREDVLDGGKPGLEPLLSKESSSTSTEFRESEPNQRSWKRVVTRIPTALVVLLVAITTSIIRDPGALKTLQWGPSTLTLTSISREDWKIGFLRASLRQIPVSILNSVISVSQLSDDLFSSKELTPSTVSISVMVMNMMGCWFGAIPVCHGAGGLAGQYRFGARSGLSVVILGAAKVVLGLVLGSSLLQLLTQFPIGLLGVFLFFSGVELAVICRDQHSRLDSLVMLVVTVVSIASSSTSIGFLCGVLLFLVTKTHDWLES